jgi:hypothetical protein
MIGYIKDKKTFQTKCAVACIDYDLTLCSIYDEKSTVAIPKNEFVNNDDFIYLENGYFGIIQAIDTKDNLFALSCNDIGNLFSRKLFPPDTMPETIEAFISDQIQTQFIECTDELYAIPFIQVEALTGTPSTMRPDVEDGVFSLKGYIAKARRLHNVFVDFKILKDTLFIQIQRKPIATHTIDFSDRSFEVLEENYSSNSTAKITAKAEDTGSVSNWYLLDDGTTTNTYQTQNRANGNWDTLFIHREEDIPERVAALFAKNTYSHLIEFRLPDSKMKYEFYDRLRIRTKSGLVLYSYVSGIRKTQATFTTIQSGELRVLFTDQNKEVI